MPAKHKKDEEPIYIPMASMSPDYTVLYYRRIDKNYSSGNRCSLYRMPFSNQANGLISAKAERRIKKAISWLIEITPEKTYFSETHGKNFTFKLNFITLTLPAEQMHPDSVIKKNALNQFLTECRNQYKVKNYIWRAEAQKNGNIHFHLCFDQYIHHSTIRKIWCRIIGKLGYIDAYRQNMEEWHKDGFKVRRELLKNWSKQRQYSAYLSGMSSNWALPNCTDVHAIKKIRNLSSYLAKYCSKNSPERPIDGKLWGLSNGLSACTPLTIELVGKEAEEMKVIQPVMEPRTKVLERCSIIFEKASLITSWYRGVISEAWRKHVSSLRELLATKHFKPIPT